MYDKRRYERFEVPLEIRITWQGHAEQVGITKDSGDGGVFLKVVFEPEPPPGTVMELQLTSPVLGKSAPVLKGRVVRTTADGIAFEFVPETEAW